MSTSGLTWRCIRTSLARPTRFSISTRGGSPRRKSGSARIADTVRLRDMRPFRTDPRMYYVPKKSVFTKIVGEPHSGGLALRFARLLGDAPDLAAFAKNDLAVGFKLDYVRPDGDLSNYVPDFVVRTADGKCWVVEAKGRAELDPPAEMARLAHWCADATKAGEHSRRRAGVAVRLCRRARVREAAADNVDGASGGFPRVSMALFGGAIQGQLLRFTQSYGKYQQRP